MTARGNHNLAYDDTSTADHIDPRTLSKAMDDILPKDRTVVVDGGHFVGWVTLYFSARPQEVGAFRSRSVHRSRPCRRDRCGVTQPERLTVLARRRWWFSDVDRGT